MLRPASTWLAIILFSLGFAGTARAQTSQCDFAILDPQYDGDQVAPGECAALESIVPRFGWTFKRLGFDDINQGALGEGGRNFKALVVPGGQLQERSARITDQGNENIREFVRSGGGYIGFCGGAFEAAEKMIWAKQPTSPDGRFNLSDGYKVAHPHALLGMFPGTAIGPLGWAPHNSQYNGLEVTRINTNSPTMRAIKMPAVTKIYYHGGPVFEPRVSPPNYEVWGWAIEPTSLREHGLTGSNMPSIVRFSYGRGNVVLFAHHPSLLLGGRIGTVQIVRDLPGQHKLVNTDPSPQSLDEVNFEQLNILHGALQLISDRQVTALNMSDIKSR